MWGGVISTPHLDILDMGDDGAQLVVTEKSHVQTKFTLLLLVPYLFMWAQALYSIHWRVYYTTAVDVWRHAEKKAFKLRIKRESSLAWWVVNQCFELKNNNNNCFFFFYAYSIYCFRIWSLVKLMYKEYKDFRILT
jgi:hypothetical protein